MFRTIVSKKQNGGHEILFHQEDGAKDFIVALYAPPLPSNVHSLQSKYNYVTTTFLTLFFPLRTTHAILSPRCQRSQ